MSFARIVWVVLDGVGIGEMPDAAEYGDTGSDTLGNIASQRRLYLPTLCCLGLGNIRGVTGLVPEPGPIGCYGRCAAAPPYGMLLDQLSERGVPVTTIGEVSEVFLGREVSENHPAKTNAEGMAKILDVLAQQPEGLIWANLIDFDMLHGHRNDVEGYAKALEEVDAWLPQLLERLGPGDLLVLTAGHGCDPTTPSTDHSREYVPLVTLGPGARRGVDLGTRDSLADIGQTVAENFETRIATGLSFLDLIEENPDAARDGHPTLPVN